MWARFEAALGGEEAPVTHGAVLGQVWRGGGPRQALLARALRGVDVRGVDEEVGKAAGALLARTGGSDVVDAAVVLLARDGDTVLTSDPDDLVPLAAATGRRIKIVRV